MKTLYVKFTIVDYQQDVTEAVNAAAIDTLFTVSEHKTSASHGAATFAANPEEKALMDGYFTIRKGFVKEQLCVQDRGTKQIWHEIKKVRHDNSR